MSKDKLNPHCVQTMEQLSNFILELRDEYNEKKDWENCDMERYLSAMSAFVGSMDVYYKNVNRDISSISVWQLMAEILLASKYYE
ncbi:DUF7660 family protein [Labrys wisconsinensis]|uniref:DUF7660 family protein n=1 Tax=Labrys wisconsinensis TaxID=425677 RepID=UPI003F94AFB8